MEYSIWLFCRSYLGSCLLSISRFTLLMVGGNINSVTKYSRDNQRPWPRFYDVWFSRNSGFRQRTYFCSSQFNIYCRQKIFYHICRPHINVYWRQKERRRWRELIGDPTDFSSDAGMLSPEEPLLGWTTRTIDHALIPRNKTNELAKRDAFTVGDYVCARNFWIGHSWTARTVVKRRWKPSRNSNKWCYLYRI